MLGVALLAAPPGRCEDRPSTEATEMPQLHVVFRVEESLADTLNSGAIQTELAEYPHIKITVDTPGADESDENNIGISAAALLGSGSVDAVIWFSGTDSVILYLYSRFDERFERKRTIEGGVASNVEAIFAIVRGWLDAMAACPPKPAPDPPSPPPAPQISIRITSANLSQARPPTPSIGRAQIEFAATGTYATQLLMGASIGISLPIRSRYALFAGAAVYAPVKSRYMDVSLSQRKHPLSVGIRRNWQLAALRVGMGLGVEVDIYRLDVSYQNRQSKFGVQPAIIGAVRGSWLLNRRISIFVDAGGRLIFKQPVYEIVVYSETGTEDAPVESRRVRLYDARAIQPTVLVGIAVRI